MYIYIKSFIKFICIIRYNVIYKIYIFYKNRKIRIGDNILGSGILFKNRNKEKNSQPDRIIKLKKKLSTSQKWNILYFPNKIPLGNMNLRV